MTMTRDELVRRVVRAGELEVSGEDQAETDTYFDAAVFRFHGPDGFETDYAGLTRYFESIRSRCSIASGAKDSVNWDCFAID